MTATILGLLGFATLFAVAGLIPLEKRSCHGSCSAESAADCAACPFAPGAGEPPRTSEGAPSGTGPGGGYAGEGRRR